jgi:hypothetical protein
LKVLFDRRRVGAVSRSTGDDPEGSRMPITRTKFEALRADFNEALQEFDQVNARVAAGGTFTPAEVAKVQEFADRVKVIDEQLEAEAPAHPSLRLVTDGDQESDR